MLTARIRAVSRSVPDIAAADGPGGSRDPFREDYAAMLRQLADPVRQLADLRSSRPRAGLAGPSGCQRHLEREAARLPEHSDGRSAALHLARLTREMLSEIAEHHGGWHDPASRDDR